MTRADQGSGDEGRHPPGEERWWGESWYFDFVAPGDDVAGYCRLGLYPNQDAAWFWFHVVARGEKTVQIRDHSLACPDGDVTEIVGPSASAGVGGGRGASWSARLERGPDSWRITTKGTATALDGPLEAYGEERGTPVDIDAELCWTDRGPRFEYGVTTRYEQTCRVRGRLMLGDREWTIGPAGQGQRDHSWGVRDWNAAHLWCSGALDDGRAIHVVNLPAVPFTIGYSLNGDDVLERLDSASFEHRFDADGLPVESDMTLRSASGTTHVVARAVGHAPVLLSTEIGPPSRFPRSVVALESEDTATGWGWIEYNLPSGDPSPFG